MKLLRIFARWAPGASILFCSACFPPIGTLAVFPFSAACACPGVHVCVFDFHIGLRVCCCCCCCVCVCVHLWHATNVKLTKNNTSSALHISFYFFWHLLPGNLATWHSGIVASTFTSLDTKKKPNRCGFMYGELTDKETVGRLEYTLENQQQDQFEILLYKKNSEYTFGKCTGLWPPYQDRLLCAKLPAPNGRKLKLMLYPNQSRPAMQKVLCPFFATTHLW